MRELTTGPRIAFFESLATTFGHDRARIDRAIAAWRQSPTAGQCRRTASMPASRGGSNCSAGSISPPAARRRWCACASSCSTPWIIATISASSTTISFICSRPGSIADFWCCAGSTGRRSAAILEKIIRYEAVHEISDWDDLRRRIDPPDRRCYAFFHPALVDEPLIFVEVALTREIPAAIAPILSDKREPVDRQRATTAVFYSITNCQRGLAGVTFGHFLIKQVVEEVSREMSRVATFVTLSPAPNFAEWLNRERANAASQALDEEDREALAALDDANWWRSPDVVEKIREPFMRAAAWYYVRGRNCRGVPVDAVARFHLGNGARLERLDWLADTSERALKQSYGLMVNYLYDLDYIERNHEAYAQQRAIVASSAMTRL